MRTPENARQTVQKLLARRRKAHMFLVHSQYGHPMKRSPRTRPTDRLDNAPMPAGSGPVRLGDLVAANRLIWIYCLACCHEVERPAADLPLDPACPVPDVARHLICSQCGGRRIITRPELYEGGVVAMRELHKRCG